MSISGLFVSLRYPSASFFGVVPSVCTQGLILCLHVIFLIALCYLVQNNIRLSITALVYLYCVSLSFTTLELSFITLCNQWRHLGPLLRSPRQMLSPIMTMGLKKVKKSRFYHKCMHAHVRVHSALLRKSELHLNI
jgi:hypothetical protein